MRHHAGRDTVPPGRPRTDAGAPSTAWPAASTLRSSGAEAAPAHAQAAAAAPHPGSPPDAAAPDPQSGARALDGEGLRLLDALRMQRARAGDAQVCAAYGPGESIAFDFRCGLARSDRQAEYRLRLQRELPRLSTPARMVGAVVRDLDAALWDIGAAAGAFRLLDAPADWWHAPLVALRPDRVAHCSRVPLHLDLARALTRAAVTPAQLRRASHAPMRELCGFLQACLFLELLRWDAP